MGRGIAAIATRTITLRTFAVRTIAGGLIGTFWAGAVWAACAPDSVDLRWNGGKASFHVEVADTAAKRETGLMFRQTMDRDAGMIFTYDKPEHAYYWMKNTVLPLDILFFDQTGRLNVVQAHAVPGDLTPLDGGEGVSYVLEINAGLVDALHIPVGAEMRGAAMDGTKTSWTCAD